MSDRLTVGEFVENFLVSNQKVKIEFTDDESVIYNGKADSIAEGIYRFIIDNIQACGEYMVIYVSTVGKYNKEKSRIDRISIYDLKTGKLFDTSARFVVRDNNNGLDLPYERSLTMRYLSRFLEDYWTVAQFKVFKSNIYIKIENNSWQEMKALTERY